MFFTAIRGGIERRDEDDGRQPITFVRIGGVVSPSAGREEDPDTPRRALVDTGARRSAIRGDLARRLGFSPFDKINVEMPWGALVVEAYDLEFRLPNGRTFYVLAAAIDGLENIDVIIGMDIIRKSVLTVNGRRQSFRMSFPRGIVVPR